MKEKNGEKKRLAEAGRGGGKKTAEAEMAG